MTDNIKIVRGYYLTGLGQEPLVYYFKITDDCPEFETLKAGDIGLTFYQNGEVITSIPALIRVDCLIDTEKQVNDFLQSEKKDNLPMLPIVSIYEDFDPIVFSKVMIGFQDLKYDMKRLAKLQVTQGNLFDFLNEEESL
ncbi:MAG: hypothetical protein Q4A90_04285 [Streptococcus sp.]|nr:hypothetical protein [Streptococcus sp.]